MAITTMDGLVAALPGQVLPVYKPSIAAKGAGTFASLWTAAGTPGAGATPATGAGAACTSATTGALKFSNPGSGFSYLARALMSCGVIGTLVVYDRLVATSGLSGIVTTAQTISSTALTRYTTGANVSAWLEWYTATGASAVSFTLNYTNEAGATAQVSASQSFPTSPAIGQMLPISLNGADGIQVAESLTLTGTTGTAGNFGVTLLRRLLTIPLPLANSASSMDAFAAGLQKVEDSACLAFAVFASTTTTGLLHGEVALAQG